MPAILEVLSLSDRQPISFHAVRLFHRPCTQEMRKHRSPADDTHSLRCACGLEIVFPVHGAAERAITEVAIGEQSGTLPDGSFTSVETGAIEVRFRSVG